MSKHTCCWVLQNAAPGTPAVYCNKPVTTYRIVRDDDNNKVRKYDTLCSEHHKQSLLQNLKEIEL